MRTTSKKITSAIAEQRQSKDTSETLSEQTKYLHLLERIAVAANEASVVAEAMQICLDEVCTLTGWPVGHVYLLAEDGTDELTTAQLWHLDKPRKFKAFRQITESTRFAPGIGLPGRVMVSGKPAWIIDVTKDPNFPRAKHLENIGLKAAFGFPVLVGKEVAAVLEFFTPEAVEPNEQLLEVMAQVGTQLGRVIERERAQEALRQSQERFELAVKGTNDGMWDWPDITKDKVWLSTRFYELLGYEDGEFEANISTFEEFVHHDDLNWTRDRLRKHFEERTLYDLEYRLRTKSGAYCWVRGRGQALWDENGNPVRISGSIQDITERKRIEEKLRKTQNELELRVEERNAELRESEVRFRDLFEASHEGIFIHDRGTVLDLNQSITEIFGYERDQMIGKNILEFVAPESRQEVIAHMTQGIPEWYEVTILTSSGSKIPTMIHAMTTEYRGKQHRVVCIHDISELKQAEAALQEAKEAAESASKIARTTLENMGQGILMTDSDLNLLVYNDQLLNDINVTREQAENCQTFEDLVRLNYKPDDPGFKRSMELAKSGKEKVYKAVQPDGKIIEVRQNPLADGGIVRTYTDITERKQTEERREFQLELEHIVVEIPNRFKTSADADVAIDASIKGLGLLTASDRVVLWQFTPDRTNLSITYEWCADGVESSIETIETAQHIMYATVEDLKFFHIIKTGIPHYVKDIYQLPEEEHGFKDLLEKLGVTSMVDIPIMEEGHLVSFYTLNNPQRLDALYNPDISIFMIFGETLYGAMQRQKAENELIVAKEQAELTNQAKSDFLANMSHEIRTPMNAIIGLSDLALRTELSPKQRDYLNKVHSSANALLGIINDILDFSKIEAGKLDMESVPFSVDSVLENLATVVRVKTQEKGLELLFSRAPDVPPHLVGDPLRLGQVLVNLANNAVKFTDEGEILLSIRLVEEKQGKVTLKFSVRDTGIGMTEKQMGKLFQSFSQADTSTSRKYGGTGLGLSISKQLIELMGGEIRIESELGKGSTFVFEIVLEVDKTGPERNIRATPDLQGMRVLVVDDNPNALEILGEYLTQFGFKADCVASGEAAIEKLQDAKEPYRLVLMDYIMPGGMDGLTAVTRINKEMRLPETPKIILVTAYGHSEYENAPGVELLDNELSKPVNPSLLLDVIMQTFGHEAVTAARGVRHGHEIDIEVMRSIQGARILLVEDNLINQQVVTEILEQTMFFVDIAQNGQEALDMLAANNYDCVLMDIQMPVMDGYTATSKIREQERYKELPVLAITANVMVEDRESAIAAGMNDHIAKPINPRELFTTLLKWIEPGQRELPGVTEARSFAEDESDTLPDQLFGIDINMGLQRVGGNHKLLRKLLGEFYIDHGGDISAIHDALEQADYDTAQRLAHTIKGVAAAIGASELNIKSNDLESAIKQGQLDNVTELVEQLSLAMSPVLEGLSALATTTEKAVSVEKVKLLSSQEINRIFDELTKMLEEMDPDSEEKVTEMITQFGNQVDLQLMKRLARHVSGFEFEQALELLVDIRSMPVN